MRCFCFNLSGDGAATGTSRSRTAFYEKEPMDGWQQMATDGKKLWDLSVGKVPINHIVYLRLVVSRATWDLKGPHFCLFPSTVPTSNQSSRKAAIPEHGETVKPESRGAKAVRITWIIDLIRKMPTGRPMDCPTIPSWLARNLGEMRWVFPADAFGTRFCQHPRCL